MSTTLLERRLNAVALPEIARIRGTLSAIAGRTVHVKGLSGRVVPGTRLRFGQVIGEVIADDGTALTVALYDDPETLKVGMPADCVVNAPICPSMDWRGNILDHEARRADGTRPIQGSVPLNLNALPPKAALRRNLGPRLHSGFAALDTFLPLCRGQRVGLFAGSGVGKTTLLGNLAKIGGADITIIALIGERGREVRHFTETVLGPDGMENSVIFVATSDAPPAVKLRTARMAMATAEVFRDAGKSVLLLFDSVTRFAQSHRQVALAQGETPALRAFPPSTFQALSALCERAGPGLDGQGDITAIFSVLVEGSDMEEPVADTVRGILDGHIILDRAIAERGRYPAIDIGRSVSRALPGAATEAENNLLNIGRSLLRRFNEARLMIQSGLYAPGGDLLLDQAVKVQDGLDTMLRLSGQDSIDASFEALAAALAVGENQAG